MMPSSVGEFFEKITVGNWITIGTLLVSLGALTTSINAKLDTVLIKLDTHISSPMPHMSEVEKYWVRSGAERGFPWSWEEKVSFLTKWEQHLKNFEELERKDLILTPSEREILIRKIAREVYQEEMSKKKY